MLLAACCVVRATCYLLFAVCFLLLGYLLIAACYLLLATSYLLLTNAYYCTSWSKDVASCFDVCINRASSVASRIALLHSWTFASIAGGVASGIDVCMHRAALLHALTFASIARGISSRRELASKCSGSAQHLLPKSRFTFLAFQVVSSE